MNKKADVVIVGTGVAGLFSALNLPDDKEIIMTRNQMPRAVTHFWHRAESVYSGMNRIMTVILKIR